MAFKYLFNGTFLWSRENELHIQCCDAQIVLRIKRKKLLNICKEFISFLVRQQMNIRTCFYLSSSSWKT